MVIWYVAFYRVELENSSTKTKMGRKGKEKDLAQRSQSHSHSHTEVLWVSISNVDVEFLGGKVLKIPMLIDYYWLTSQVNLLRYDRTAFLVYQSNPLRTTVLLL